MAIQIPQFQMPQVPEWALGGNTSAFANGVGMFQKAASDAIDQKKKDEQIRFENFMKQAQNDRADKNMLDQDKHSYIKTLMDANELHRQGRHEEAKLLMSQFKSRTEQVPGMPQAAPQMPQMPPAQGGSAVPDGLDQGRSLGAAESDPEAATRPMPPNPAVVQPPAFQPQPQGFDEAGYHKWYEDARHKTATPDFMLAADPDSPDHHYKYRQFYTDMLAGKPGAVAPTEPGGHWPSTYKTADHPRLFMKDQQGRVFNTETGTYLDDRPVPQETMKALEHAPDLSPKELEQARMSWAVLHGEKGQAQPATAQPPQAPGHERYIYEGPGGMSSTVDPQLLREGQMERAKALGGAFDPKYGQMVEALVSRGYSEETAIKRAESEREHDAAREDRAAAAANQHQFLMDLNRTKTEARTELETQQQAGGKYKGGHRGTGGGGGGGSNPRLADAAATLTDLIENGVDGQPARTSDLQRKAAALGVPLTGKAGTLSLDGLMKTTTFRQKSGDQHHRTTERDEAVNVTDIDPATGQQVSIGKAKNAIEGARLNKQNDAFNQLRQRLTALIADVKDNGPRVIGVDSTQRRNSLASAVQAAGRVYNELGATDASQGLEHQIMGSAGTVNNGFVGGANVNVLEHMLKEAEQQHKARRAIRLREGAAGAQPDGTGGASVPHTDDVMNYVLTGKRP